MEPVAGTLPAASAVPHENGSATATTIANSNDAGITASTASAVRRSVASESSESGVTCNCDDERLLIKYYYSVRFCARPVAVGQSSAV